MLIFIDTHSGVPIYDQIYTQIKALIIKGEVKENDMLPSIRSLAKELRISVITTKRAYDELEKEGYVYTVPAKGCFVAKRNTELIKEQSIMKLEEMISQVFAFARENGISRNELLEIINNETEELL